MCGCAFNPRLAPAARPLIQAKPAVVNGVPRSLTKTKGDGALSLCRAAIEQFRQPREIDCHLSRLVHRQKAGMSCYVWVGSTVEHAELLPSGILDSKSARDLDDPPRRRKATGHVSPLCPLAIRLGGTQITRYLTGLLRKQQKATTVVSFTSFHFLRCPRFTNVYCHQVG